MGIDNPGAGSTSPGLGVAAPGYPIRPLWGQAPNPLEDLTHL